MTKEKLTSLVTPMGFSNFGSFEVDKLVFMDEVIAMCKTNRCGNYGAKWICPPAIPGPEEMVKKASSYAWGMLVQTTAQMEDPFDGDAIETASAKQHYLFLKLVKTLSEKGIDFLPMSSGGCHRCTRCTYPYESCRFPEEAIPAMEAYGLMVHEVCQLAEIPYYYGKNTVTFTSCVLLKSSKGDTRG